VRFKVGRRRSFPLQFAVAIAVLAFGVYLFWVVESHLKPTLLAIAEARATVTATQIINNVIHDKVARVVDPQTLVIVSFDSRGRVALIRPNTMEFNRLAADTTIKVQEALQSITEERIQIPFGQVLGSQLLASLGPKITVTVIPIGTVQVKVFDKFEQAGINQTRHMVYLMATTQIRIVVPLVSKSIDVNTQVPIAEYVVVGEVPSTYVQIPNPFSYDNHGSSAGPVPSS